MDEPVLGRPVLHGWQPALCVAILTVSGLIVVQIFEWLRKSHEHAAKADALSDVENLLRQIEAHLQQRNTREPAPGLPVSTTIRLSPVALSGKQCLKSTLSTLVREVTTSISCTCITQQCQLSHYDRGESNTTEMSKIAQPYNQQCLSIANVSAVCSEPLDALSELATGILEAEHTQTLITLNKTRLELKKAQERISKLSALKLNVAPTTEAIQKQRQGQKLNGEETLETHQTMIRSALSPVKAPIGVVLRIDIPESLPDLTATPPLEPTDAALRPGRGSKLAKPNPRATGSDATIVENPRITPNLTSETPPRSEVLREDPVRSTEARKESAEEHSKELVRHEDKSNAKQEDVLDTDRGPFQGISRRQDLAPNCKNMPKESPPSSCMIRCRHCHEEMPESSSYYSHKRECVGLTKCYKCGADVPKANMRNHRNVLCTSKAVRCRYCEGSVSNIKKHRGVCPSKLIPCQICEVRISRADLEVHTVECESKKCRRNCDNCGESVRNIRTHLRICPNPEMITCRWCKKKEAKWRFFQEKHIETRCTVQAGDRKIVSKDERYEQKATTPSPNPPKADCGAGNDQGRSRWEGRD